MKSVISASPFGTGSQLSRAGRVAPDQSDGLSRNAREEWLQASPRAMPPALDLSPLGLRELHEFLASACMKVRSDQRRVDLDQARFVVGGSLDRCDWAL